MEQQNDDKRIPIDQFMSFADARLVGGNPLNGIGSILWDSYIGALEAGRKERNNMPVSPEPMGEQVALKGREPHGGRNVADVYSVTPGEVPGGAIGVGELKWPHGAWRLPSVIYHNGIGMPVEMIAPDLLPAGHPAIAILAGESNNG